MKHQSIFILGIAVLGLLSGCSSSDDTPPVATSPVSTVLGIVANAPEDGEPIDIDAVQLNTPEDGEPEDI